MTTVEIPEWLTDYARRDLPDGSAIEYEYAPYGHPKKNGYPRRKEWRRYFYLPATGDSRVPVVSVTTLLSMITAKDGLVRWAESQGIEGAVIAMRRGEVPADIPPSDAVKIVRDLKLGSDAQRDKAAGRGLNVHELLEDYMNTGEAPNLADHPVEHHGYVRALCSWLLERDPEPESVEQMVCDPDAGYAGRRDLVATVDSRRIGYDAKTQKDAKIFLSAHLQLRLYEMAGLVCGDPACDDLRVVVFAADGKYREMLCEAPSAAARAALEYYRAVKPINGVCESANAAEWKARR